MLVPKIVSLVPVAVEKPWGREVWFSGVETRGESGVRWDGIDRPLSRVLEALGRNAPITLLKRLEPDYGNLYLEVHATKHEVYVAEDAGTILAGTDAPKDALRTAARQAYEGDTERIEFLMSAVYMHPGDAIDIPPGVVHSLRRGVDVIEFQTPVYERKILTAYQPVLTQTGWDIDEALALLDPRRLPRVTRKNSQKIERLASTPGFRLERHRLDPGERLDLGAFAIAWRVSGDLDAQAGFDPSACALMATADAALLAVTACEVIVAEET